MTFILEDDPQWYKDAIIYEVHVRAFYDSNADGIGDFRGLTEKLDYLQDLGVTAIWLLPFYPSPLKDDGYDISDYTNVHPSYGVLQDFRNFLREAHERGLRVITELVVNHTSDQHSWFQRARRAKPGSLWRDFYVWNDSPDRYKDARIIFKDFESSNWTWDSVSNAYYWHRFYHHQPDLNFENPEVVRQITHVMKFWLNMGVDGMRLDAVPYLFEREGTNCENLPETHAFLRQLRGEIDARFRNRMLLAEANQWPEDAVAYFGSGDECHMTFHFPVMPRMFMALRMEDRFPIVDILAQTPAIPENSQWALFLRNHDELTLEMVTDEERDYMYRAYAHDPQMRINLGIRRRLAALLGKDWNRIELMNALLFSLPGTPVLYYGDEIGMGDNIYLGDRNGVRTPMQWSADRNAGFSRSSPHRLYLPIVIDPEFHYEAFNVEAQQNNPHSILWWTKRLIAMRKRYKAFGRGTLEFLSPDNHRVLAFIRRYQDENILVVANLSRFPQHAGLDLRAFKGSAPMELFGRTVFPQITDAPYILTMGPHSFYWFALTAKDAGAVVHGAPEAALQFPVLEVNGNWKNIFQGRNRTTLEESLPQFLARQSWFTGTPESIKSVTFNEALQVPIGGGEDSYFTQVQVEYTEADPEVYNLALGYASGEDAEHLLSSNPATVVARVNRQLKDRQERAIVYDAVFDKSFARAILEVISRRRHLRGDAGEFAAFPTPALKLILNDNASPPNIASSRPGETNSSVIFDDRLVLKFFRKAEPGPNPDFELGRLLSHDVHFPHVPPLAGSLQYQNKRGESYGIAILHGFVPNEGTAWRHTLDALSQYLDRAVTRQADLVSIQFPTTSLVRALQDGTPPQAGLELMGPFYETMKLLGRRAAELHIAMASGESADYAPEPFTVLYQRSVYQSMRNHAGQMLTLLRKSLPKIPGEVADDVVKVLDSQPEILNRFRLILSHKISAKRTRTHGDFQLEQILYTGKDFIFFDFKGEPGRPLTERRIKRSPLRDVAGMLRSFHYAAYTTLFGHLGSAMVRREDFSALERWVQLWNIWISSAFLGSYIEHAEAGGFLPTNREDINIILEIYLLEKVLSELGYEVNNRIDWVRIPLIGIRQLLEVPETAR